MCREIQRHITSRIGKRRHPELIVNFNFYRSIFVLFHSYFSQYPHVNMESKPMATLKILTEVVEAPNQTEMHLHLVR